MINSKGSEWNRWDLHVHTASSYDYTYKGTDADNVLCNALIENDIKAAVITDHFKIDNERINNLRSIAPDIKFFPGVELRTDKGADNLHLVLVFSDLIDIKVLADDFEAIMIRQKAKGNSSPERIYWEFKDIVDFAKERDALITIHAGHKSNGIDQIKSTVPVKDAIKDDIASNIHFFEIGQKRDIITYEEKVFPFIDRKPLIMCSDNHDPNNFSVKEYLWIKADLTFDGLKQCIYQPQERVYIGNIPPVLDRTNKNKQNNIASITCSRIDKPSNKNDNWFDFKMPLNPSMVAIIGNKGSGKSAFADIIGHLCCCNTMDSASFLNDKRFNKTPKNYGDDYTATLSWLDDEKRTNILSQKTQDSSIEYAQYLPQKYIEEVCNAFGDVFQKEINKVIFSYVDKSERGETQNLDELVKLKSKPLEIKFYDDRIKLTDINRKIINLERKKTQEYHKTISDKLDNLKGLLNRHEKSKPVEVNKPVEKNSDAEYQIKLSELNLAISKQKKTIESKINKVSDINSFINDAKTIDARIMLFEEQYIDIKQQFKDFISRHNIEHSNDDFKLELPRSFLKSLLDNANKELQDLQNALYSSQNSLYQELNQLEKEKYELISSANIEEKKYQKYLDDLSEWEARKNSIIGTKEEEGTIEFYKFELDYLDKKLALEYNELAVEREKITKRIYKGVTEISEIYQGIYLPIQGEIELLLGDLENGILFQAEVFMKNIDFAQNTLEFINQRYNGKYGRSHNSINEIESRIKETDFSNEESVMNFVRDMADVITSDIETADKRVERRQEFYDFIFGLEYIGVDFKLKMGGRSLQELSPGERGIVLLIFYLALSKESKPIIIDQPEDNLDNQSVYSKLVPCICRAKERRQVIIVTHNPNIAVACDAEQIIYCEKNTEANEIVYEAGAIENPTIRKHVIDVLEGTMPAFDLRRLKYK